MEKQRQMLSIILVLFVLDKKLLVIDADQTESGVTNNVRYFQVSNTKTQIGGTSPAAVQYNSIDGSNGVTVFNNGTFAYSNAGIYFALFASQIGSPNKNGRGEVHLWVRRSLPGASNTNTDAPNTNTIQTIERGATTVLVFQRLVPTFAGYTAALTFTAFTTNKCSTLGLVATAPANESVVPAVITSVIQISNIDNQSPLAQLSSSETQLGSSTVNAVKLNTVLRSNEIDTTTIEEDGAIKYNVSGLYFAIGCAQVGSAIDTYASGEVHLWMRLNGEDIPNSNTIQTIHQGSSTILVSQTIAKFKANDKLQLVFSTTNKKIGLIASTPNNEPAAPSMVFSTFQLDSKSNSIPYAQLSSLKTQWGCLTSKVVQFDQDDGSQLITNTNGTLEFEESGTYFLVAAAQVASCRNLGIGDVHVWMGLNGQDIANSNTIQTVNGDTGVLICQTILEIKVGDRFQVLFSADVTKGTLGLVATLPQNESAVPSMIFSAFKSVI